MIRLRLLLFHLRLSHAFSRFSRKLPHIQKALLRHLDIHKKQQAEHDAAEKVISRLSESRDQLRELSKKAYTLGFDQRPIIDEILRHSYESIAFVWFGRRLTNLNVFIIICLQDLLLVLQGIRGRSRTQASNFAARLVALNCHEITDKLLQLLGNHRLSRTGSDFLNANTNREIKRSISEIRQLKKQHGNEWELLRHNCVAHRDDDAFKQLEIIESLDALPLLTAGLELSGTLMKLITCLNLESHKRAKRCAEIPKEFQDLQLHLDELTTQLPANPNSKT
jgi:hypothetical protein